MENIEPSHSQYNWIEQPIQKQAGGKKMSFWANISLYVSAETLEKYLGGRCILSDSQRKAMKLMCIVTIQAV